MPIFLNERQAEVNVADKAPFSLKEKLEISSLGRIRRNDLFMIRKRRTGKTAEYNPWRIQPHHNLRALVIRGNSTNKIDLYFCFK
jgi:hypothetical protein